MDYKLLYYQNRLNRLINTEKNIKSPGVIRKCQRKIRKYKNLTENEN